MKKPDEIFTEFKKHLSTLDKKKQVAEIIEFTIIYGDSFGVTIIPLIDEGIKIARDIGFESGEIIGYCNLAFFTGVMQGQIYSNYTAELADINQMVEKIKHDAEWYPLGLNLLSYFHWFKGEYEKGFNLAFEGVKESAKHNLNRALAWNYYALAIFYFDTKDFDNSKINYQLAFDLFANENYEYGMARSATGLGTVAIVQNRTQDALPLLEYAAATYRELGHYSGLSRAVNDMGLLEKTNRAYDKAIKHLNESIEVRKEINHIQGLITSYTELGETYLFMKNYELALKQFNYGLEFAMQANSLQKQMRLYKLFYDTYKELNNPGLALKNFEQFYEIKTQLMSDEAANNIKKIQTKYETEKSEKEAEIERLKNVELKKAYTIIEEKNKDILDSIRYAKRIQNSLLPTEVYIENALSRVMKKN